MIITLSGVNNFALQDTLIRLANAFVAEEGELALERLDGEEVEFDRIRQALTSLPFLANKKMVVLRTPGANKQFAESAEKVLTGVPETTDVVLIEPKPDKRSSYYKFLKAKTEFRDFPELDQNGLARWLVATAKEQGGALDAADARYLIERVGTNQQLLSSELEKLLLYQPQVARTTIDLLTDATPQSTIFQLLEAAFAGNRQRTLTLYGEQRALKVEPPQIIAMLAWQLHVLAILKTAGERTPEQVAREAKLNPFVIRRSQAVARRLSLPELKTKIQELLQIDIRSKRSGIDLDEALQHYLLSISI